MNLLEESIKKVLPEVGVDFAAVSYFVSQI